MSLSFVDEAITFIVACSVEKEDSTAESVKWCQNEDVISGFDGEGYSLDAGDSIVVAMSFSHMLDLANLAEEVQICRRRRNKVKKGDFADENNATTESNIEETLKKLVFGLKKSPQEVFDALKNQTVDLVLTTHPTQLIRILSKFYAKDITPDDKQELDDALLREILTVGTNPLLNHFDMNGTILSQRQCAPSSSFSIYLHPIGVVFNYPRPHGRCQNVSAEWDRGKLLLPLPGNTPPPIGSSSFAPDARSFTLPALVLHVNGLTCSKHSDAQVRMGFSKSIPLLHCNLFSAVSPPRLQGGSCSVKPALDVTARRFGFHLSNTELKWLRSVGYLIGKA
ncbi:hypothetical protein LR48_Vigan03g081100 [Vigna angularis]|uniref:Phosphoenolpyruvate carboxylase n=1 Tax=Phaseolus angularis TaxID=3914 RepID=A0A0L9U4V6_PHAAN|nr:hypothetical protein LR48_Vigan03g081100 [Vigna angularis]